MTDRTTFLRSVQSPHIREFLAARADEDLAARRELYQHLAEQSGEVPPEGVYLIDPEPTPPTEEDRAWVLDVLARSRTCSHCPDPSTCGGCDPDLDGDVP